MARMIATLTFVALVSACGSPTEPEPRVYIHDGVIEELGPTVVELPAYISPSDPPEVAVLVLENDLYRRPRAPESWRMPSPSLSPRLRVVLEGFKIGTVYEVQAYY